MIASFKTKNNLVFPDVSQWTQYATHVNEMSLGESFAVSHA